MVTVVVVRERSTMRGKLPLVACVLTAGLGVAAGAWPEVRAEAFNGSRPSTRTRLAAAFADRTWATARPGSWTPPRADPGGMPAVVKQITTKEKVVFLTIDDGYEYDAEFVNIVRRQKVPILTFLTSAYVRGHGQYFWSLRSAGSAMENHTIDHPNMAALSAAGQKRQICGASATIERQYGRRPQIFRPPFGSMNATTLQVARECGIKSILLWSAEFYNGTKGPSVGYNGFARADGGSGFRPGDIVLMHYRKGLAQQLTMILGWIRQQGFRPAAIESYLPRSLGGNAPG